MERFSSCAAEKKIIRSGGPEISSEWPPRGRLEALRQQVTPTPLNLFSRSGFRHNLPKVKKSGVPKIGDFEGSGAEFEDSGGLGV